MNRAGPKSEYGVQLFQTKLFTLVVLFSIGCVQLALACSGLSYSPTPSNSCQALSDRVLLCDQPGNWSVANAPPGTIAVYEIVPEAEVIVSELPVGFRSGVDAEKSAQLVDTYARLLASEYPNSLEIFRTEHHRMSGCELSILEFEFMARNPVKAIPLPITRHALSMLFVLPERSVNVLALAGDVQWQRPTVPFRVLEQDIRSHLVVGDYQ